MADPSANAPRPYLSVAKRVEDLFEKHGDSHRGLGYPKPDGYRDRQRVFLDVMRFGPTKPALPRILEIGCATGILLDYYLSVDLGPIEYRGIDVSEIMISTARKKHPNFEFIVADPIDTLDIWSERPDYVIMGGIFTWCPGVPQSEMLRYMTNLIKLAFSNCNIGIAFNVMSKHVDWERNDLLHVAFDHMASILRHELSRNFVFRADYGLYEFTTYVYR